MRDTVCGGRFTRGLRRLALIAAFAALGGFSLPAAAEESDGTQDEVFALGTLFRSVVEERAGSPSELMEETVGRTQIQLFEQRTVDEAIMRLPGVRYVRPRGGRFESGVVVRGFSAFGNRDAAVPLFVDGIPASVPYDYSMDMGRFTTGGLSAISVSKGYGSVLYGPNALGGVVNIVSQRPTKPLYGNATFGIGTGDTIEANGIFGTLQDRWYAQVGLSYLKREFIHAADTFTGTDSTGQERDTDRKNYGTRDKKMEFKVGFLPNQTDEYVVSYLRQTGRKGARRDSGSCSSTTNPECWALGYIESWWEWPYWDRETLSYVSKTHLGGIYLKPRVYYDKYDNGLYGWGRSYATRDDSLSRYDDYAWGGSLEIGTAKSENNELKGIFSYKFNQHKAYDLEGHDGGRIDGSDEKLEEQVFYFALEDTYRISEQWEIQGGLLYSRRQTTYAGEGLNIADLIIDYPTTDFGLTPPDIDSWDPQGVVFYKPTKNHAFHYSIAKKTRFPSIRNQFSNYGAGDTYNAGGAIGRIPLVTLPNPGLKPEKALHHEVGWDGKFFSRRLAVTLDLFYSTNRDLIDRSTVDITTYPGYAVQQVVNVAGDTRRSGMDLGVEYIADDRLLIGGSFSYLHSENKDVPAWRPTHPAYNGSLYASIRLNRWASLVPAMDYFGRSRYSSTGANRWAYNQGAALVDLKLSITPPMHRNVSINFGAENLFNTDYRGYNDAYPSPGRYYFANVRYAL